VSCALWGGAAASGPVLPSCPKTSMSEAYRSLVELSDELAVINSASALLGWDQEVLLPRNGVEHRARQLAWMSGLSHRRWTGEEVGEWIASCESEFFGDGPEAANVREWRHDYERATALPVELVEEFAKTQSLAKVAWASARESSDFGQFAPFLTDLIELTRRKAEHWGGGGNLYDVLLDTYERGAKVADLDGLFGRYRDQLVPLVHEAVEGNRFDQARLLGDYPEEKQEALNREVAESIGFDFEAGRIDTAVHPFCSGMGPGDVRLTTRYDRTDFRKSLFGVLHETGHGLYEQGLPAEYYGQPVGQSVSLGVHESQSRLWENHVGRSPAFWEKWLGRAIEYFPGLSGVTVEEMVASVNQASLSHIRVDADEVTYDLHILLRYDLEKRIFAGELAVEDIPAAWNEEFERMFGERVKNDTEGCLQDIHWSMGIFGYFPTYTLGNLNASQLFAAAMNDSQVANGFDRAEYGPLLDWMRKRVHGQGRRLLPADLVERASGASVSENAHLTHLRKRYLER